MMLCNYCERGDLVIQIWKELISQYLLFLIPSKTNLTEIVEMCNCIPGYAQPFKHALKFLL